MSKKFQIKDLKPMASIEVPKELIGKGVRFISEEDYVEYLRMKETAYYVKQCDLKEKAQQIAELQKQLAEKDEEIAYLTKQVKKFNNEAQKYFEDAYCNDFHNQDKTSFAIAELEKVKEMLQPYLRFDINLYLQTIKNIDNQIKRLTHQHEEKGE